MKAFLCLLVILAAIPVATAQPVRTQLAGQVELPRLIDLCAERLGLNIEYDAQAIRGTVTLRLGASVSDDELWALTNRVLASRGFTSVRMPGENLLSIVRLADAPAMARLEDVGQGEPEAGFMTVIARIEHQPMRDMVAAVRLVLSKQGSAVSPVGETGLLMISDLKPRLDEAMRLIDMLDVPFDQPMIQTIATEHLSAMQIATLVTAAAAARDTMSIRPLRGKLTPSPDGNAVIVIAPASETSSWNDLIRLFDQREVVEGRTYTPRHFAPAEVSRLVEQTARVPGPRGSGDRWRLVSDELTGTLFISATPSEHALIETLLERLDAVPAEARRPMRAFPIRNRNVREIVEVLSRLIESGALEAIDSTEGSASSRPVLSQPATGEPHDRREGRTHADLPAGLGARQSSDRPAANTGVSSGRQPLSSRASNGGGAWGGLVLTPDEGTNTLIAVGQMRLLAQVEQLLRTLDVRQPQVMIEVLVISLSDGDTLDLGVELQKLEVRGSTVVQLASLFGLGTSPAGLAAGTPPGAGRGFTGSALSPGDFSILLRALETINRGRSLNMPKVLVSNNQQAMIDSVLQQPFASLNAFDTVATTSFGGTQDAGTVVTVTPQIAEGDHLLLTYAVTLSSFVGESTEPGLPPPRQQNRLSSVVNVPDGYTVVVGGLEATTDATAVTQIPLLGSIPLIGEAFKNRSQSQSRSRFYVFIRPTILRQQNFEDLKYLSDRDQVMSRLSETHADWPPVAPRIIR